MRRNIVVVGATLAILAVFALAGWTNWKWRKERAARLAAHVSQGNAPNPEQPLVGKMAPEFTLEDMKGRKVTLESLRGKAVLVNFWATWCGPCKIETPWLIELRNKYASEGFEVVGIDTEGEDLKPDDKAGMERERAAVKRFVEETKIPYPVLLGGDTLSNAYGGIEAMPTSFYLDRKGVIVAEEMGVGPKSEIEGNIRKSLGR